MRSEIKALLAPFSAGEAMISRRDAESVMGAAARDFAEAALPRWDGLLIAAFPYYVDLPAEPYDIARYAWGRDYHRVIRELLAPVSHLIEAEGGKSAAFCDTSPLPERELAAGAGLGLVGDNGLIITPGYGSYVLLGGLLTAGAVDFDPFGAAKPCLHCGACAAACPGGALAPEGFRAERCISALTQKRGALTDAEAALLRENNAVWGCDRCQEACPLNQDIRETQIPALRRELIRRVTPEMAALSNREFTRRYGGRAFAWRGAAVLRRNLENLE